MSEQPVQKTGMSPETQMRFLREIVAATLALVMVVGVLFLAVRALAVTSDADQFNRVKDILNVVIPLVTFALGYYFNKTTSDARAESAEMTAQVAVVTAQQATQERDTVKKDLESTQNQASELLENLETVTSAAEEMMTAAPEEGPGFMPAGPGVLSAEDDEPASPSARAKNAEYMKKQRDLQLALERAKRLTYK